MEQEEEEVSQELTETAVLRNIVIPFCFMVPIVYFGATKIDWNSILAISSSLQGQDFSEIKTTVLPLTGIIWLSLAVAIGAWKAYQARLLGEEDSMTEGLFITATMAAPVVFFKIIISGS